MFTHIKEAWRTLSYFFPLNRYITILLRLLCGIGLHGYAATSIEKVEGCYYNKGKVTSGFSALFKITCQRCGKTNYKRIFIDSKGI